MSTETTTHLGLTPTWWADLLLGFVDILRAEGRNEEAEALRNELIGRVQESAERMGAVGLGYTPSFTLGEQTIGPARTWVPVFSGDQPPGGGYPGRGVIEAQIESGRGAAGRTYVPPELESLMGPGQGLQWDPASESFGFYMENPSIDLNQMFQGSQAALDLFRERTGEMDTEVPGVDVGVSEEKERGIGYLEEAERRGLGAITDLLPDVRGALGTSRELINKILGEAKVSGLAESVTYPEADLSQLLKSELEGIGAAGKRREELAQTQLAARAPLYGGLESPALRGQQTALTFEEAGRRAGLGLEAGANVRELESEIERFNADLRGTLASREAQMNTGLAELAASLEQGLGLGEAAAAETSWMGAADLLFKSGLAKSGLLGEFTGLGLKEGKLNALIDQANIGTKLGMLGTELGLAEGVANAPTQRILTLLDLLTGERAFELQQASGVTNAELAVLAAVLGAGLGDEMFPLFSTLTEGLLYPKQTSVDTFT